MRLVSTTATSLVGISVVNLTFMQVFSYRKIVPGALVKPVPRVSQAIYLLLLYTLQYVEQSRFYGALHTVHQTPRVQRAQFAPLVKRRCRSHVKYVVVIGRGGQLRVTCAQSRRACGRGGAGVDSAKLHIPYTTPVKNVGVEVTSRTQ